MSETRPLALAAEFPPATREQWLTLVEGVLKGASFEKKLVSRTHDGLRIEPLYVREANAPLVAGRGAAQAWAAMQRVDHPDPAAANAEALHDLENGTSGLTLVIAGSIGARGFGIEAKGPAIRRTLDGVHLDAIPIELDLGPPAKETAEALVALVRERGIAPPSARIRFGFDPLGAIALAGSSPLPWREIAPQFAALVRGLASEGFAGPHAVADGRVVHDAGGSEAQELAFVLAAAVAYLRALEAGMPLDHARHSIFFRLSADADQFLTMAKFRALRKLWARVEEACGLAPKPVFVSAETAWRMMTQRDPYVNMLRTTIAAFAAGLGGADAVSVLPFTAALGLPDRFARRIARNSQLVLLEESALAKVADPAAGSGAFEDLTRKLCMSAWTFFQEIERAGGAAAALEQGLVQTKVAEARRAREAAVATRKDAITGTSAFPNIAEGKVSVLVPSPLGISTPDRSPQKEEEQNALRPIRLAQPFEALRDASDRVLETSGARLRVFLATLGSPVEFTARAAFAKNFFEAGGIEAIAAPLPEGETKLPRGDFSALASSFKSCGATLACLCSSDEVYAREAAGTAQALSAAGARHIYLAGRPKELEAALREAGVSEFIYAGCDALAILKRVHATIAASAET